MMQRPRINTPVLVRSTTHSVNSSIVRKAHRKMRRAEDLRAVEQFVRKFDANGRFIYIDNQL